MAEWKEYKLGNFIKVKHGFAFKGNYIVPDETDKILVTPGNFHIGGGFKSDKYKYYKSEDFPQDYILKSGDVVVTMTDLSKDSDTLGYSAKKTKTKKKKYLHNQRIGLVQFVSEDVCPDFIYWLLRTKEYQNYIVGSASGTSIMHTSPSRIENYSCLFPPLPTQRRIASILSSLDDKIDLLHRENATLEQMAETMFRQWFVVEAKEEWEEKPQESKWFSTNPNDIKWLSIKDMGVESVFLFNTAEYLTKEAVEVFSIPIIPKNTVVLSFKMTVGRVGITTDDMLSNEAIAHFKFRNDTPFSKEYLYIFLKTYKYETLGSTSSIVTAINSAMIKDMGIVIPDTETMERYRNQTQPMFDKIFSNQEQINTLIQTRDGLLPKLMSNEIAL